MNRVGIELSASHCRIVEIAARRRRAASPAGREDARVHAFASIAYEDGESLRGQLRELVAKKLFSRHAWVTLWGLASVHHFMLLPPASPGDLDALARREARRDLTVLQVQGAETSCGVALGRTRPIAAAGVRREVLLVAAPAEDVRTALQPLVDAGFIIEGVVTPALALAAIGRLRGTGTPGAAHAYLAINRDASGLAIVRDGLLLFAREIPWGYQSEIAKGAGVDRDTFSLRLASELRRSFLFFRQTFKAEVQQVVTCGEMPDLRSTTAPLMAALDLEVETLDSMEGIDVTALPHPVDRFREQVAALRLAWAVAADAAPPINLLPSDIIVRRDARRQRAELCGGLAAAAAVCALLFWQADTTARAREQEWRRAEQELSRAEPQSRAFTEGRERQSLDGRRLAALDAFDSQGPRLARALEVVAQAPEEIVLNALKVRPAGAFWRATIGGVAVAPDPALGSAAVNRYLRELEASPYLGAPVRSPGLRMTTGDGRREAAHNRAAVPTLPPGMSGIEFTVEFEIRK